MDSKTKSIFSKLNKDDKYFDKFIEKITLEDNIDSYLYSYALSLSIIFYDEYLKKNKNGYLEFSYYLVLVYSLKTKDYTPLLMFSINNGLYPIAKSILTNHEKNIQDIIFENGIDIYKKNNIIELKKQSETRKALIESDSQNRAFIAPTSYGKSTAIIEDIEKNNANKIGIIVPKKALIWQTFRNIKNIAIKKKYKALLHDTEYNDEKRVICIFTQERALRLIQDSDFYFDVLYIDEAHNLFEKDERNILLARLIKLNKKINEKQRLVFLSPLIKDSNDLIVNKTDYVEMQKIDFNIKEPKVSLFNENNSTLEMYNRFVDKYYIKSHNYINYLDYLSHNLGEKNLFYFNKPKDIEDFSFKLLEHIKEGTFNLEYVAENFNIKVMSDIISKYVNSEYKLVELIKYGIVYIHGKMPDSIKDYIINKFIELKEMKILISNSSVLEGMNLSLDTMFVFDVYGLNQNNLINLCGRVNRLKDVFPNNLEKLLYNVNFIDLGLKSTNFKNKISMLRSDENDDVKNPLLVKAKVDDNGKKIAEQENEYINNYQKNDTKMILIKNGISSFFKDLDEITEDINKTITTSNIDSSSLISKINSVFLTKKDNICDFELARLSYSETRNFYNIYLEKIYHIDLKTKIIYLCHFFKNSENMYIGNSFGEKALSFNPMKKAYINFKEKNNKDKINYAVIKSKIEDDFLGFKIGKLVKTLLDLKIIDENEFNMFTYGTNDAITLSLIKTGISPIIIKFIEDNELNKEYTFENGMIKVTEKFKNVLSNQDDYIKFEVNKFII